MIRINLLPVREARRRAEVRRQGVLLGLAALAALAVCIPLHLYEKGRYGGKLAQLQSAKTELAALQEVSQRVDAYRKEQQEIEKKLEVIGRLERSRTGPVRVMDEIATRMPGKMWLTRLSLQGGDLQVEGVSLDAEIVAAFLTGLEESAWIDDVELEETRLQETEGLKLNTFRLRGAVKGVRLDLPDDAAVGR